MAPTYYAVEPVLQGIGNPVPVGEPVPDTYIDSLGNTQSHDFKRLEEVGAVTTKKAGAPADADPATVKPASDAKKAELVAYLRTVGEPTGGTVTELRARVAAHAA